MYKQSNEWTLLGRVKDFTTLSSIAEKHGFQILPDDTRQSLEWRLFTEPTNDQLAFFDDICQAGTRLSNLPYDALNVVYQYCNVVDWKQSMPCVSKYFRDNPLNEWCHLAKEDYLYKTLDLKHYDLVHRYFATLIGKKDRISYNLDILNLGVYKEIYIKHFYSLDNLFYSYVVVCKHPDSIPYLFTLIDDAEYYDKLHQLLIGDLKVDLTLYEILIKVSMSELVEASCTLLRHGIKHKTYTYILPYDNFSTEALDKLRVLDIYYNNEPEYDEERSGISIPLHTIREVIREEGWNNKDVYFLKKDPIFWHDKGHYADILREEMLLIE